ncbi:MAG TPA: MBL fold metallo-hydrolase [Bacteroidetes bacterium]|nr:MBL fold metallo-hydrolase [Bacteroidota bacterium]
MILKFWGAARTVTGSMHLLELDNGKKILLDCGLYQGRDQFADEFNRNFPCPPSEIDYLILSHAHIDHCGNIPQLVKDGFKGRIYCTHATFDLVSMLLLDSARIQEKDAEYDNKWRRKRGKPEVTPLYTPKDVPPALKNFVTLPYDKWIKLEGDVELLLLDAGHMLGSASVSLRIREEKRTIRLGFTGDVGRPGSMILRDAIPMPQCDYLISESTYGGKTHEVIKDAKERLLAIIQEACVEKGGKLIIPAFSVGRTQNIVHTLDQLETEGRLPPIPVYVDSPLAVNTTDVFRMHPECYDETLLEYLTWDPNPFGFNNLHYVRDVKDSKALNTKKGPFIVISASGMMTGGRVMHHLSNSISDARNTILVVGYCAKHTLGARIVNGAKEVKIFGQKYKVKATVKRLNSYSGHAGENELYDFIRAGQDPAKIKNIFLVHGEEDRAQKFQKTLSERGYKDVIVPMRGESVTL